MSETRTKPDGTADYKVETKATIWKVVLSRGAYSDYEAVSYFIRANDRDEAWHLFKLYWTDLVDVQKLYEYSRGSLLIYVDQDDHEVERFKPTNWYGYGDEEDEPNWDTGYGSAWNVSLHQLQVVEFRR